MRVLVFNLAADADDPVLGFTMSWVDELARRSEYVDVVTMRAGRVVVADNVRVFSVGKEKRHSEVRRLFTFYGILLRLLWTRPYDAAFAHMMPLFALLGGPLLLLWRVPLTLWYAHRRRTLQLRCAMWFCRRVVSAHASSFPFQTAKLRPVGHGIDTEYFRPGEGATPAGAAARPIVLHVARLTSVKHQATLVRAAAALAADVVLVGDVPAERCALYKQHLKSLVAELGVGDRVVFAGNLPREAVREWYRRATVAVNLSPVGLFDKAALESMACGVPTVVSNPAFDSLLGPFSSRLRVDGPDDVDGLARALGSLLSAPPAERQQIGSHLRDGVRRTHDLGGLAERLVRVFSSGEPA